MSSTNSKKIIEFRKTVLGYWKKHGRHDLPWRKTRDPYRILVSEVMLQQTQVPRVLEKYREFLKKFPTARALSKAPLSEVLKTWNGLGYNRRGKYLQETAKAIARKHKGLVPKDVADLRSLPGMGPYTASAVRVFAFDLPDILIETNIRTAYIHHFFPIAYQGRTLVPRSDLGKRVRDVDVIPLATLAATGQDPRQWHWALMDYGAYLKKSGVRSNERSAHYTKQSKFEGSLRQVRGAILRELYQGPTLVKGLPFDKEKIEKALEGLARDGLIEEVKGSARGGPALGRKWRVKRSNP